MYICVLVMDWRGISYVSAWFLIEKCKLYEGSAVVGGFWPGWRAPSLGSILPPQSDSREKGRPVEEGGRRGEREGTPIDLNQGLKWHQIVGKALFTVGYLHLLHV